MLLRSRMVVNVQEVGYRLGCMGWHCVATVVDRTGGVELMKPHGMTSQVDT